MEANQETPRITNTSEMPIETTPRPLERCRSNNSLRGNIEERSYQPEFTKTKLKLIYGQRHIFLGSRGCVFDPHTPSFLPFERKLFVFFFRGFPYHFKILSFSTLN
ncbi:hypothetical protein MtrunA17_Chr4g0029761 [Medicago truncatula]|uniref:Uncharacterized protein n=1 Tax=Medicago truncatula TaxID=3880 RepID=G7JQG9_MEDTR|nr:hypothetical protein MTR_4g060600 [Medicago truncatula]AFK36037.1 unknown [Medicago truncatula]RHN60797.1 hypothetical protein MtrunA17_Chr4g0029761 [Medicago truncatula]